MSTLLIKNCYKSINLTNKMKKVKINKYKEYFLTNNIESSLIIKQIG